MYMPNPDQPKPCDQCHHFGGWLAIDVAGETRTDVHSWCQRPGAPGVIAIPKNGCAFWVKDGNNSENTV